MNFYTILKIVLSVILIGIFALAYINSGTDAKEPIPQQSTNQPKFNF